MKTFSFVKVFFQKFFYDDQDTSLNEEILRKISLIQLFNFIGVVFVTPLGLKAIYGGQYAIAIPLLIAAVVLFANYYYLKESNNEKTTAHVIVTLFFALMLYLTYTGGINNTGHLWITSLPLLIFFLLGLQKGMVYVITFLLLLMTILFLPFDTALKASYTFDYKLRILLSFLLVTFLAALYEYNNEKSLNNMLKLKEEHELCSTRDHLTQLYNRRGYDLNIKSIKNTQGIVLMCDIDHFKKLNDTYGHDTGDLVLREVAKKIKDTLREHDMAVRWGGEEFFIFLPHTTMDEGNMVAEKIRISIASLAIYHQDKQISVTCSIGLDKLEEYTPLEKAITNADNAMYLAKQSGRNTVMSHDSVNKKDYMI